LFLWRDLILVFISCLMLIAAITKTKQQNNVAFPRNITMPLTNSPTRQRLRFAVSFFAVIVFSICTYYIVVYFDWVEILKVLDQVNMILLVMVSVLAILVFWFLRALRWSLLLRSMDSGPISFRDIYLVCASGLALSVITPFQSGELLKVEMLHRVCKVKRVLGYTSFTIERLLDLSSIIFIAFVSMLILDLSWLPWWMPLALFLVLSSISIILYKFITRYFAHHDTVVSFKIMIDQLFKSRVTLSYAFGLSLLAWAAVAAGWMFCLAVVDVLITVPQGGALISGVTLISIASFIPGAIGVSEVSISALLVSYGITAPQAQAGALLIRSYTVLAILLGLIHSAILYYGISWNKR
jgi:uncharacterized membrane protein YbhN (UPF0104 family)